MVDTDSEESRFLRLCCDAFLGGSLGGPFADDVRVGRLGGVWEPCLGGSRGGSAGGTLGGCGDGPLGRLPISCVEFVALLRRGGLLTVLPRGCPDGLWEGGGGGGAFLAVAFS
jgi:hypothetical protein